MPKPGQVTVDHRRFLLVDGIPVCRVTDNGKLEFKDKDGNRAKARGSAYVTVDLDQVYRAVGRQPE